MTRFSLHNKRKIKDKILLSIYNYIYNEMHKRPFYVDLDIDYNISLNEKENALCTRFNLSSIKNENKDDYNLNKTFENYKLNKIYLNEKYECKLKKIIKDLCLDGFISKSIVDNFHYLDRKSTRLNSSHANISYAVF